MRSIKAEYVTALVVGTLMLVGDYGHAEQVKDYSFFLEQLIDLDRLAVLEEGIQCKQFSSYDRKSRYDEATGEYIDWSANGDCGKYIRVDKQTGEAVMAQIDGPGCIWRIWSANPQGKIRFYLDGAQTPTYEFDFNGLFAGKVPGFPRPLIWQRRVNIGGDNPASDCYMPIPFTKGCKVTADKAHNQYYHIGYSTFPADRRIKTFSLERTPGEEATLQRVCAVLNNCGADPQLIGGTKTIEKTVDLAPGELIVLAELEGPATIRQFHAKLISEERWAHRKVLLQMYWDNANTAAVEAPIGDFFGDAWDETNYKSLPLGITDDLNYCYWRMPFAESGRIVVTNEGKKPGQLRYKIVYKTGKLAADTALFHAKWRRDRNSKDFDYPFLECNGRGRFVGVVEFPDNITGGWWGEGDEKVYVDGEKFPSTFGTGSEDYFGDAWGIAHFNNAFHGCPTRGAWNTARRQSCYRWHIADNIPFAKSFKITIENYSALGERAVRNDFSSMAYWYQAPGGADFFTTTALVDRIPQGPVHAAAINAEDLVKADQLPAGATIISDEDLPEQLCREKGLKISGKAGTTVTINLPAPDKGWYTLETFTAAGLRASRFELLQSGKPIGDRFRLAKGSNPIEVRLTGEPIEGDRCEVILDFFVLHPYINYVRNWYLIGPFDNQNDVGFDRTYGPETEAFDAGKSYEGIGGEVRWQKTSVKNGIVDSRRNYFDKNENIVLYGYCEIVSPDDRRATMLTGSDDGIKVWVNGEVVHGADVKRGMVPDQDRFDIQLKQGRNPVLVKITQAGGPWAFVLRVDDPEGELKYALGE